MNVLNKFVVASLPVIPKSFVWVIAKRYIAGKKLDDVTRVVREMNKQKAMATIDVLGEFITQREESYPFRDECIRVVKMIDETKIDSNLSLKLTQYGLKIDTQLRDEVQERVKKLDAPAYTAFVQPNLELQKSASGDIGDVKVVYPLDLTTQMLEYSAFTKGKYDTEQSNTNIIVPRFTAA